MLRERRVEKNLTLLQVATKINKTESYLSKLEMHPHECNPSLVIMLKLAIILEMNRVIVFEYFAKSHEEDECEWFL